VACTGATPVAATNCLNFGNPQKPEIMAQLSLAIDGIAEACNALGTPVTGGNVSLYNETLGEGIYPTPVIGIVGILDDVTKAVPSGFQKPGDHVIVASYNGQEADWNREVGSSEVAKLFGAKLFGQPPTIDLAAANYCNELLRNLAVEQLIHSASDIGGGGLAVALSRASLACGVGADVALHADGGNEDGLEALFRERVGSVIITCSSANADAVIKRIESDSSKYVALPIGKTCDGRLAIRWEREMVISEKLEDLASSYGALESALAEEVLA
jgi:phosphoribosylformylglycinamidine synthase